jgi:hypothetical protein
MSVQKAALKVVVALVSAWFLMKYVLTMPTLERASEELLGLPGPNTELYFDGDQQGTLTLGNFNALNDAQKNKIDPNGRGVGFVKAYQDSEQVVLYEEFQKLKKKSEILQVILAMVLGAIISQLFFK